MVASDGMCARMCARGCGRGRGRRPGGDVARARRAGDGEAPTSASRMLTDDVYVRARAMCDDDDAVIEGLKYAASHEWAKIEGDVATIGITDHAQVRARRQSLGGPQQSTASFAVASRTCTDLVTFTRCVGNENFRLNWVILCTLNSRKWVPRLRSRPLLASWSL